VERPQEINARITEWLQRTSGRALAGASR
jgi:hypothetical protein